MNTVYRRGFDLDPRTAGPATKWLSLSMILATVVFSITQRQLGFGVVDLLYSVPEIFAGQLWRLLSYPFVETSGFSLILGVLVFYLFAKSFEERWGTRDFLQFVALSALGAAILAIPVRFVLNFLGLFNDVGQSAGPGPIIDAMLVALALTAPNAKVLFGFVLPMRATTMVYVFIGIEVLRALVDGSTTLSLTLGGLAMGYILITGIWRPDRWGSLFNRKPKRRRGLYVVPPKKDHTLH